LLNLIIRSKQMRTNWQIRCQGCDLTDSVETHNDVCYDTWPKYEVIYCPMCDRKTVHVKGDMPEGYLAVDEGGQGVRRTANSQWTSIR
jgi:hypothetical protein